ncbi:peptidylprolyl isomerase [Terrimonas sp.]|uniref:peptidylprolyl isomerase n=1 Tax=Terrimonas sp. TaxID=1914338 RepID=UPI000D50A468|nr:peptidylprolyl isomerase [Terrimonas sp.]PVD52372.1 peptidylprolyl isomerase [Terrimonas sp.]
MKNCHSCFGKLLFVVCFSLTVIIGGGILGCPSEKKYDNPVVIIQTKFGDIKVELYPEKAPLTVAAFLQHIDSGYFKNTSFYRVLRDDNQVTGAPHSYLIQGGVWQANPGSKEKFRLIPHEPTSKTGILHTRGIISMARNEPGTATSEFFICVEDEPGFDYGGVNNHDGQGYAAFGKVVEGMNVVDRIHRQPENEQRFIPPVAILNIVRYSSKAPQ